MSAGRRSRLLGTMTVAMALAAIAAFPGGAGAAVSVGHSGWFWGDPLPQGQSLAAIDFAGSRGYAVGNFGTVLRTDDSGAAWSGLRSGTTIPLTRVQAVDANTVIAGGGCTVRRSVDGGASFQRLPFNSSESSCPATISDFSFVSPTVGFIVLSDGTVIRTDDGGRTFSQRTALPETRASQGSFVPQGVAFTSATTGVAVLTGGGGRIYRTTDGGTSWTLISNAVPQLRAVEFISPSVGYAVGDQGAFLRTLDGGASFSPRPMTGAANGLRLTSLDCASATTCLMATADPSRLIRTGDGGNTSTAVSAAPRRLSGVGFSSATRAVAVGESGTTVSSDDAGLNFSPVGQRLASAGTTLRSVFGNRAYAPGSSGRVARTLDGGATWQSIGVSTAARVADVSFPTPATGFALDSSGSALRTDNAGGSWQLLDTGTSANPAAILALDANRILLVGPRGIRRSSNGGQGFSAVGAKSLRRAVLDDVDGGGKAVFAYGSRTLFVSKDGGRRWAKVRRPRKVAISDVDFLSSKTGYLLSTRGRVYSTRSGGRRWTEVQSLGTTSVTTLSFSDAKRGFVTSNVGDPAGNGVLRTTDGGRSWQPQLITDGVLSDVAASGRNSAIAVDGSNSRFYATTSGGVGGVASRLSLKPSKKRIRRTSTIRVTGKLTPAAGGERVIVAMRSGTRWARKTVTVASNGSFTTRWKVRRTSVFVAQWRGDDRRAGDGTTAVKVTRAKAKKRKHKR
jgi:photosystem II stability/assembly factor-like uncharacterized protein